MNASEIHYTPCENIRGRDIAKTYSWDAQQAIVDRLVEGREGWEDAYGLGDLTEVSGLRPRGVGHTDALDSWTMTMHGSRCRLWVHDKTTGDVQRLSMDW